MKLKIAIDGPAGTGKSTVAKKIAEILEIDYLDTGAMYRAVAKFFLDNNIDPCEIDNNTVEKIFKEINFDFKNNSLYMNGKILSDEIRSPEVGKIVSKVASLEAIRKKLTLIQRELAKGKSIVVEGRDIGTVVLPDAEVKIFLTASAEERARRRLKELIEKGINVSFKEVFDEIVQRDRIDSTRKVAPLRAAKDAVIIDTDGLTVEEVVEKILEIVNKKIKKVEKQL
ncbi:MAG TPA: (d)CMP kinase [Thermotogaceae bacterium]|nr:(d)CMP kinase [Thermotogaceae bacterium]